MWTYGAGDPSANPEISRRAALPTETQLLPSDFPFTAVLQSSILQKRNENYLSFFYFFENGGKRVEKQPLLCRVQASFT